MFGIGSTELLVILVVALIVLGPKSMANVSRTLGKALGEFRRVSTDFQRTLNAEAEEEEQKNRKKEAAKAAREAAEAEAARAATQTAAPAAAMSAATDGKAQGEGTATSSQETPAAEAVLDTTAVRHDEATIQVPVEGQAVAQNSPEAATAAEQAQAPTASGAATPVAEAGVPVPPEGSPLAEALARTEAEVREAEARLAQTATVSDNGGKA